jgi:hypothetical protein
LGSHRLAPQLAVQNLARLRHNLYTRAAVRCVLVQVKNLPAIQELPYQKPCRTRTGFAHSLIMGTGRNVGSGQLLDVPECGVLLNQVKHGAKASASTRAYERAREELNTAMT